MPWSNFLFKRSEAKFLKRSEAKFWREEMNQKVIYQITFSRSKTNFFSKPGIKTKNSLDLNYFLVFSSTGVSFDFIAYFRLDAEIMFVFDRKKFLKLIKALDQIDGIDRFRISSIEPNLLSNEIISFVATSQKFVPHLHIPMQSGSDAMLKSMRRRYDVALYRNRISHIRSVMPDACIGADVIVGYPGETDAEFNKTVEFIKELDINYLHVFTYSERANTTALRVEDVIPVTIRQERNKILTQISHKKKRAFYESQVGSSHTVLWEASENDGMMQGFTENYIKVQRPMDEAKINTVEMVTLVDIGRNGAINIGVDSDMMVVS